jgi:deoxyribodipyrimidine photo-lyase
VDTILVWFRRDLRLGDNTALHEASRRARHVVPVFIFDEGILRSPDIGAPRVAFLLESLRSLHKNLEHIGSRLIIRRGRPLEQLRQLAREAGAGAIYWNADHEPYARTRDAEVARLCAAEGWETEAFEDSMVHAPDRILKDDGLPYAVFTPYYRRWDARTLDPVLPRPKVLRTPPALKSDPLPALEDLGFRLEITLPPAGEKAAREAMKTFMDRRVSTYGQTRNLPVLDATSRLSPHLRFGTISARTVVHEARSRQKADPTTAGEVGIFISEMAWRDFYKQILWHFPKVATSCFKPAYDAIRWPNDERLFRAWCEGRTGYPIVDAAMRQLNTTGWMHNRLRMIVASFLTKDLLVSWQWGERYFMQKLLDGDLAANNGGWQWAAGTGTDAQPYFRIFNPASQAKKFDPEGRFIEKYLPEANSLDYPPPIVDHSVQRNRALALFKAALPSKPK